MPIEVICDTSGYIDQYRSIGEVSKTYANLVEKNQQLGHVIEKLDEKGMVLCRKELIKLGEQVNLLGKKMLIGVDVLLADLKPKPKIEIVKE